MTRFSEVATLCDVSLEKRDDGSFSETEEQREVFVNARAIGASKWAAAASSGLHADHEIELRSSEYDGQEVVLFHGQRCDVERVTESGEFVRLMLSRRLDDAR